MEMIEQLKYFTCIGKGHGAPCLPATRREWESLRREPWLAQMCARIEKGDEELKHRLPVWTPSCAEFKDNHRAAADAIKPLPRLMMDFDEKGHTDEILHSLSNNHSPLTILLVEESVRRGTHVLVELPEGMDAETAQQLMKEATGFEPDVKVKGYDRCIYMVSEDHTRYVSDKLFEVTEGKISLSNTELKSQPSEVNEPIIGPVEERERKYAPSFKGVPYTSIISEYWRRIGGEPTEGERNDKLHQLAANLRAICDNSEDWLLEVMPRYGLGEQEMRSIVHSACKEPTKGSRLIKQIVSALEMGISSDEVEDAEAVAEETGFKVNVKALPIGLKESLAGVPISMHMPVLCSVLPLAAA